MATALAGKTPEKPVEERSVGSPRAKIKHEPLEAVGEEADTLDAPRQLLDPQIFQRIAIGQEPRRVDKFPMVGPEHGLPGMVGTICRNDSAIADLSDGAAACMEDGHQQRAREVANVAVLIASERRDDGARLFGAKANELGGLES